MLGCGIHRQAERAPLTAARPASAWPATRTAAVVLMLMAAALPPAAEAALRGGLSFSRPTGYYGDPTIGVDDGVVVAVGDFKRDGWPDLVLGTWNHEGGPGKTSLLLGKGRGRFSRARDLSFRSKSSIAVADLNGDRKLDLVRPPRVLLGDGRGRFPRRRAISAGEEPRSVALADFNRDRRSDLAVAGERVHFSPFGLDVDLLLGDGSGGFAAVTSLRWNEEIGESSHILAVGDFNRDRSPDVVVRSEAPGRSRLIARLLLGDGRGGLSEVGTLGTPRGARVFGSVAVADFNRDRNPDVVLDGSRMLVLQGDGRGGFPRRMSLPAAYAPAVGDLNRDRKPDLVAVTRLSERGRVGVRLGNGRGGFARRMRSFAVGDRPRAVAIADLNRDRKPDLAVAGWGRGVRVLLNTTRR